MFTLHVQKIEDVWFSVALKDERIFATSFSCKERRDVIANILENLPIGSCVTEVPPEGTALDIIKNMFFIFKGRPMEREFKLDMDRLPQFTKNVLRITCSIPRGFVATYGGIAKALGSKAASRAVGNAEAINPFAPIVPCHRVVRANLEIGGYGGGLDVKRAILKREGVVFKGNLVSKENLLDSKVKLQLLSDIEKRLKYSI